MPSPIITADDALVWWRDLEGRGVINPAHVVSLDVEHLAAGTYLIARLTDGRSARMHRFSSEIEQLEWLQAQRTLISPPEQEPL